MKSYFPFKNINFNKNLFGLQHGNYNATKKDVKYKETTASKREVKQMLPDEMKFKYYYQEQERQDELRLNWDSFKYRNYDYAIGRFMSIDPLAEKYPYNATYAFQENKMGLGRELEGLELQRMNLTAFDNNLDGASQEQIQEFRINSTETTVSFLGNLVVALSGELATEAAIGYVSTTKIGGAVIESVSNISNKVGKAVKGVFNKNKGVSNNSAKNITNSIKLNKQLASEQQMSETGKIIAGNGTKTKLRKADELAETYGGKAKDYVKKTSSSHTAPDGTKFETHWEENIKTGKKYNLKTKIDKVTK